MATSIISDKAMKREKQILVAAGKSIGATLGSLAAKATTAKNSLVPGGPARKRAAQSVVRTGDAAAVQVRKAGDATASRVRKAGEKTAVRVHKTGLAASDGVRKASRAAARRVRG